MSNFKILWYIWSSTSVFDSEVRCPSCLLSKFTSQLKLIQSVVRVGILGICVTSSVLMVLLSGFWISESQFQSPRDAVAGSWVSRFQSPGSLGLTVPEGRVSMLQGLRVPVLDLRVPDPGSQILILDNAFTYISIFIT